MTNCAWRAPGAFVVIAREGRVSDALLFVNKSFMIPKEWLARHDAGEPTAIITLFFPENRTGIWRH